MQRDARFLQAENVRLSENGDSVIIIDQTQLPGAVKYLELRTDVDFYDAILKLKVRGAPAIGDLRGLWLLYYGAKDCGSRSGLWI